MSKKFTDQKWPVTADDKASFTDRTTELYKRFKAGSLSADVILEKLQELLDGKHMPWIGNFRLWGRKVHSGYDTPFKTAEFFEAGFIKPLIPISKPFKQELMEAFEITDQQSKFNRACDLGAYLRADHPLSEEFFIKDAKSNGLLPTMNLATLYNLCARHIATHTTTKYLDETKDGNLFYLVDKKGKDWKVWIGLRENRWKYLIDKIDSKIFNSYISKNTKVWLKYPVGQLQSLLEMP